MFVLFFILHMLHEESIPVFMLMFFPDVHGIHINTSFPLSYQNVIKPLSKAKEGLQPSKLMKVPVEAIFFHVVGDEAASVIMRACASSQPKMEQAGLHAI